MTVAAITDDQRRRRLVARHHLADSATSPAAAADALVALHGTDPVTVFLALRARIQGFEADHLEQAAYEERTLVRMLGMRRTVFAVTPSTGDIVQAACTDAIAAAERRRIAKLVRDQGHTDDPEAWLAAIATRLLAHLDDVGDASARDLAAAVPELATKLHMAVGKPYAGTTSVGSQLLFLLAAEGHLVRTRPQGSWVSSQYRWARTEAWLGRPLGEHDPAEARAALARRWLAAFGPGTIDDLRWWAGWPLGHTRAALAAIGAVEVALDDGSVGWVLPDDVDPQPDPPSVAALLPSLDPTPMGWKARDWYLGGHRERLFDRTGNIGPTVWWEGRVVGGWAQRADGEVALAVLEPLPSAATTAIDAEAQRLQGWLGEQRIKSRFPTPLERELLA